MSSNAVKKIFNLYIISLFIISLIPITGSGPLATDNDISNFKDTLITSAKDYNEAGFNFDKIVDPVFYSQEVLCEGHLPIILDIESSTTFNLEGNSKNDFLKATETGKNKFNSISYKYRLLVKEDYSYIKPHYKTESTDHNIFYENNNTWNNYTSENVVIDYNETINDYRYIWKEIKDLSKIEFEKDKSKKYIIDIQGTFKAGLGSKEIDIIPNIKINGYSNSLDKYAWWSTSWSYKKEITIANSKVDDDLDDFPILVMIDADSDIGASCQNDLDDIAFTDETETVQLPHEIEYYNFNGDELTAYIFVKLNVYDSNDTKLYIYYGNAGASNQEDAANVWDDDFLGVYHLAEATGSGSTCYDSTSNDNDGTYYNGLPDRETSGIGYSQDYDGEDDYITFPSGCHMTGSDLGTQEVFLNADATSGNREFICEYTATSETFAYIKIESGYFKPRGATAGSTEWGDINSGAVTIDQWYYVGHVMKEDDVKFYVDNTATLTDTSATMPGGSYAYIRSGVNKVGNNDFDGQISEIRISSIRRSDDWITTTYNTLGDYENFLSFDSEETYSAGNYAPSISNPSPGNGSENINRPPQLSIDVSDTEGDTINITWFSNSSGSWQIFGYDRNENNGTYYQTNNNFSSSLTTYYWNVSVNDGNAHNSSDIYHFTTKAGAAAPTNFNIEIFDDERHNLTWTQGVNATHTYIRYKSGSYPTDRSDGTFLYNNTGESTQATSLTAATNYYYRLWSYNSTLNEYSSYTQDNAYTRPEEPTHLTFTEINATKVKVNWLFGSGADKTFVVYNSTGYPPSRLNGIVLVNSSNFYLVKQFLNPSTTYYFAAYSWDDTGKLWSLDRKTGSFTTGFIPSAPTNFIVSQNNQTVINLAWTRGNGTQSVLVKKIGSYPTDVYDGTEIYNGSGSGYEDAGLNPGTNYYYRIWDYQSTYNEFSATYAQAFNYTTIYNPYNLTGELDLNDHLNITWNLSATVGADKIVVVRTTGDYPQNVSDGTILYNGTADFYLDTTYSGAEYYKIFSYNSTINDYSSGSQLTYGGLTIYCKDENTTDEINFDILVADFNGSTSWEDENNTNPRSINIKDLPHGEKTLVLISADNHRSRAYYMDLYENAQYTLYAYLPKENESELYLITVLNEYDVPVENAKITFKRSIGGSYINVSTLYTDAYGQVSIYLMPDTSYKVEINKDDYLTKYADYIPDSQIYTKTFRISHELPPDQEERRFNEYISFTAEFIDGDNYTLYVNFSDVSGYTSEGKIYVYQNGTDLINYTTLTNSSVNLLYTNVNHSAYEYKVLLEIYNHNLLNNASAVVIVGRWLENKALALIQFDIDLSSILGGFGDFSIGWLNVFFFGLGVFIIVGFGKYWAGGIGIIALGLLIALLEIAFGLPGLTIPQALVTASVVGFLILMGVLNEIRKEKMKVKI